MEAKVDIRKLQILNDRVSQMIEALNQVRLSVYGLSHTGVNPMFPSLGTPSYGLQPLGVPPYGIPYGVQPYGLQPFGIPPLGVGLPFGITGLQHTPAIPAFNPLGTPMLGLQGVQPTGIPPFVHPFLGATQVPWLAGYPLGLSHTPPELLEQRLMEARAGDLFRLGQTFPFFLAPQPAVLW
jgi:hypothetical protein